MKITLVSKEGINEEVPVQIAKLSKLVNTIIDDDDDDDDEEQTLPLPNVSSEVLKKIIQFMNHYYEHPFTEIHKPLQGSIKDLVGEWYANFVDIDQEKLFELILAANYMDISPLLELSCATVASMIKGKDPEEIRKIFDINNDITNEQDVNKLTSESDQLTIEDVDDI